MCGSKRKILVVDDEPEAVEFVKAIMQEAGYEVTSAFDGTSGLEKAREEKPDLVILDIQMPGKDGVAVFADMLEDSQLNTIPVIMVTGLGERFPVRLSAAVMGEHIGREPNAYLEKPIDPKTLLAIVSKLLGD